LNQASSNGARPAKVNTSLIEVRNATRKFDLGDEEVYAVRHVTLNVRRGRFITLVGRSGSGKTTLLNLLAGLDHPTEGQVLFEGRDMARFSEKDFIELRRRRVGVVFQSFALLPLLSAYENVELPLRIAGIGARERSQRSNEVLEMVGLTRRARHRPYELSGGEQQRISIARAVAMQPDIMLADEPTGELDSRNASAIFGLFRDMTNERGMTVVATTHDRTLLDMADEIYEIADGVLTVRGGAGGDPDSLFKRPSADAVPQD
jgi:putative ABC transport system ATP-binding protein